MRTAATTRCHRLVLCLLLAAGSSVGEGQEQEAAPPTTPAATVRALTAPDHLQRITAEPLDLDLALAARCTTGVPVRASHSAFALVFTDPASATAFRAGHVLPVGAVVVKAKFADRATTHALGSTVMIKHGAGYDPAAGDWEYVELDGDRHQVLASGALTSCIGCHTQWRGTDCLSRAYLPRAAGAPGGTR